MVVLQEDDQEVTCWQPMMEVVVVVLAVDVGLIVVMSTCGLTCFSPPLMHHGRTQHAMTRKSHGRLRCNGLAHIGLVPHDARWPSHSVHRVDRSGLVMLQLA
jgi:hypothetical protein